MVCHSERSEESRPGRFPFATLRASARALSVAFEIEPLPLRYTTIVS